MAQKEKSPVAQAVRQLREAMGESQEQFAVRNEVTVRTIARWEAERPPQDYNTLHALARLAFAYGRRDLLKTFLDSWEIRFPLLRIKDMISFYQREIAEGPMETIQTWKRRLLPTEWEPIMEAATNLLVGPRKDDVLKAFDRFNEEIRAIERDNFDFPQSAAPAQHPDKVGTPEEPK